MSDRAGKTNKRTKTGSKLKGRKTTRSKGRKSKQSFIKTLSKTDKLNLALAAAAIVAIVVAAFFVRNAYFYITGNDVTDENQYPVKGVDVSSYQLEIDWPGLEDEGYKFAFIKATEGSSHVDDRFEYNWKHANRTDMRVGAYHFLSFDTDGGEQADNFISTVKKKRGMLPPAVDVEFYGDYTENHPSVEKVTEILDSFLEKIEDKYGMKPIIYTNAYVYKHYISGRYDDYPIWISSDSIPETLSDGRSWTFCQYTFYGKSENIADGEKYVDINVFNGSSWELRNYKSK